MKKRSRIIAMVISMTMLLYMTSFGFVTNAVASVASETASSFAKGADVGWLPQMEGSGDSSIKFKDDFGTEKDCLQTLKDHGVDSIRLRARVNPSNDSQSWRCSTAEVVYMAKRAADMGFRIMIDLHYS